MSEDSATTPASTEPARSATGHSSSVPQKIYLVSYPKVIFLYPTFLAALGAACYMVFAGNPVDDAAHTQHLVSLGFLAIFAINLVVIAFDFPRTTSLTLFFFLVAAGVGVWFLFSSRPEILPVVGRVIASLKPLANATFYFFFAGLLALIYLGVGIAVQFDYWEVRPNELLHHHGLLSDLKRYSAPNLRIDKEINDVFEYMLLRSGRLILHPSQERRAIVLENVFFINHKEQQLTKMLGALQVQVRPDSVH